MDSDKRWYDIGFVIRGTMRTEGYGKADAAQKVLDNLNDINYNQFGYDNRELIGNQIVTLVSVAFVPQGYRTEDM